MLKGRQTGGMHRGHAWVFRAESYDTMMAWYADMKVLSEKSGKERDAFVRRSHARSLSGGSMKAHSLAGSSDGGLEEDEADAQPYSSEQSVRGASVAVVTGGRGTDRQDGEDARDYKGPYGYGDERLDAAGWRPPQRPSPGGRFPSDLNVHRGLQAPLSASSGESSLERDRDMIAAAGAIPGSDMPFNEPEATQQQPTPAVTSLADEKPTARVREHDHHEPVTGRSHHKTQQESDSTPPRQYGQQQQYFQPQQEPTRAQEQDAPPRQAFTQSHQSNTPDQQESTRSQLRHTQSEQQTRDTPSQFTADPNLAESQSDSVAPAAAPGFAAAAIGGAAIYSYKNESEHKAQQQQQQEPQQSQSPQPKTVTEEMDHTSAVPAQGTSSPPIMTDAATMDTSQNTSTSTSNDRSSTPAATSSSQERNTGPPSTVPTSIYSMITSAHNNNNSNSNSSAPRQQPPTSYTQQSDTYTEMMAECQPQPSSGMDAESGSGDGKASGSLPTKPAPLRTTTSSTISDLHIPGNFPKTPGLTQ